MQEWEEYEEQILKHLSEKFPKHHFKKNDFVIGRHSKVKRQIDISMRTDIAGSDALMVIECKCINKNIDVKVVDSFIGFLDDVNATLGVIVTKIEQKVVLLGWMLFHMKNFMIMILICMFVRNVIQGTIVLHQ